MSPDHPAMNAPAMDHELKSTHVNDPHHTAGNYYDESIRFDSMLGLKLGTGPGPPSAPSAPSAQGPSDVNSAAAGAADAYAGAALGEEGNNYGIKQEGIFTSPSILLDSFPISHPVEYTDDEDDAHDEDEDDEDDEDFVETAAQLSSVDGRFAEEGDCKQEGNGKQKWISTSPAVPINSHPIADGDSDEEDAIDHAAAIAATAPAAAVVPPAPSAAAAVPATHAAASIVKNAVPNHEFKTTTSARGVPILVARDRPGNRLLYDVIIVFVAVGIPPTVDTFGTSGRVRGRLRCEESLQQ